MSEVRSTLVCQGCDYPVPPLETRPFGCPRALPDDDIDHALRRELNFSDAGRDRLASLFADDEPNPFLRFRELFHSYRMTLAQGLGDGDYLAAVERLDAALTELSGSGLRETPFQAHPALAAELGCREVWAKNETGNFGGTHKGRHLAGLLIWLLIAERLAGSDAVREPLAIASCGNAALAASIAARSVGWPIDVFVPPDANPSVVECLLGLDARLATCRRRPGEAGDPCYLRFLEHVGEGALPFTCQGPSNGLVIEGGQTLVWEMVSVLGAGAELDRLFIQTGGGALATACITAWREARAVGAAGPLPAVHAVQTAALSPLSRAYDRLAARIAGRHLGHEPAVGDLMGRAELAVRLREGVSPEAIAGELRYAARHRSEFMWPWEGGATSIADAILDDETYDWLPVVAGMLESGGYPVEVSEAGLMAARELGPRATGIDVGVNGGSGLAGALALGAAGLIGANERLGLIFTGIRRRAVVARESPAGAWPRG